MKEVIGTFFNDKEEDFQTFVKLFTDNGYEIAKQGGDRQAVVIADAKDENKK